jgi:hypothetical protein
MAIAPAGAAASTLTDDATADFAAGTPDTATTVVAPGSVQITRTIEGFDAGFPASLTATQNDPDGSHTVASSRLSVDGELVTAALDNPGAVADFQATFSGEQNQHAGFGTTLDGTAPFAIFTTEGGGHLSARTFIPPSTDTVTPLTTTLNAAHAFRVEWSASKVDYFVDDVLVASHTAAVGTKMSPLISDFFAPGGTIDVDSMTLYHLSGTFTSRVFDASDAHPTWGQLNATVSGTATFETRSGNAPTPDSTWSAFQALGANGAIQSPSARYIQYRATLSGATPSLDKVTIDYVDPAPTASIGDPQVSGTSATVSFSSPDADIASFECSLDGAAYAPCASPKAFAGLAPGGHTIYVRPIDKAGNTGSTVSKSFTIAAPAQGGVSPSGGNSTVQHDTLAPTVTVAAKSLRASKRGTVDVKVGCPAAETSCKITVQLMRGKTVAAKKTVTVAGGTTKTVTLQLTKAIRRQLASHHSLKITAVVAAKDAAGNKKTTKKSLTLRG